MTLPSEECLFVIKKNGKLIKYQDINEDPVESKEVVFVWDDESEAKEFARLMRETDDKNTYVVCEFQLVCSKAEWN